MLAGKHIGLRALDAEDLPQLLEWRNKPEFRVYFREHRELSLVQQKAWFESIQKPDSNARMFGIANKQTGELLGVCGLCFLDLINRSADFSIYIGHKNLYIDDTYAVDTAQVLFTYGFGELGLHRIWAEIYDIDTKKQKFFTQLGLRLEGRFKEAHWTQGKWCDSLFYGILSSEFNSNS